MTDQRDRAEQRETMTKALTACIWDKIKWNEIGEVWWDPLKVEKAP